ncbi:MAG: putative electron transport protein YccM [Firmicutes bacterium ADurb.Bin506]|nr:MAG: putative electron transport protein YccM [Firmicutes bacterium ADurb.Bin506]
MIAMAITKRASARRTVIQAASAAIVNSGLPALKACPFPGLNCYACPLASMACPMGSLQNFLVLRRVPIALVGLFAAVGGVVGRAVCGWACPFGFIQDLLARIGPRRKLLPTQKGSWMRYAMLILVALIATYAVGAPLFCKICPAGALEAGIPQVILRPGLRSLIGVLFWAKIVSLVLLVAAAILIKRPFCRFLCPLGAVYSPFNKVSLMRLEVDDTTCTRCDGCKRVCPVDLAVYEHPNSDSCIRCLECTRCPSVSVTWAHRSAPTSPVRTVEH